MEDRTLKRIWAEMEEQEADTDSRVTKRRFLQTSSEPLHPGTGSSSELVHLGTGSSYSRFKQPGPSSSDEGSVSNKFDVFICHRGPDTKQTLAYHLYDMLCDRGVQVFLDKEALQSGETLTEAIEEALACSHVHVCILSSGFAESPWCLRELVMMLHKQGMGTSTLIPIFSDVEPSDVRHVKGDFGQGFQKLKSKGRYYSEDIDQWREALCKIAEIQGYEGKGEFCRTIVNRICKLLDVGAMVTSGKVVGIEKQLASTIDSIMRCRQNRLGVTLVEISGIAGIGKTTFAKELYNNIYSQYQRYCFIEDVNGLVEKGGVNEVHKQLLSQLFKDEESYPSEIKKHLSKRLQDAEILLVLDNIHRKLPLSTVFIENVSLSPGSIIIVTCREKELLKHDPAVIDLYRKNLIQLKIYRLDFDTSKEIFCRYAFAGIDNVKDEFNELINKMVEKCNGIPLVLVSLGASLREKDIGYWNYLWISIKDSLLSDVKEILKFTYDNLGTELEKCLFLDVATFFHLEKEEVLVEIRQSNEEDGELKVRYALDALKKNLLIHVSYDGVLCMHDVFVDLGKSIVADEHKCPGSRSRVWLPSDVKNILSFEKGTKMVKALSLVSEGSKVVLDNDEYPWPADAFSKMSSLEILILHGDCIEGDLSKLSRRLLWLKWTNFPSDKIPQTLCIKHVRVLHMSSESMIDLWEHSEREAPSNLRKLIVQDCRRVQRLPESMGKLRQLASLNLHECTSLKIIPDSFGQLRALKHLEFVRCHALECLPETFGGLTRLHSLTIRNCCSMVSLPESFGDLRNLSKLIIERCHAMVSLPESFGELVQLEFLDIHSCHALEGLPQSLRCCTNLDRLEVSGCGKLRLSPKQFQGIHSPSTWLKLSVYEEEDEDDMQEEEEEEEVAHSFLFGSRTRDLRNFVQRIQIKPHTYTAGLILAAPPPHNNNKNRLSDFELTANHVMESASALPRGLTLTGLTLGGLRNVRELTQSESACNLRRLTLQNCYNLSKLPESMGSLSFLTMLYLHWCLNLEEVDAIGNLQNLSTLQIHGCLALKEVPSCIGNLSGLQDLSVIDCWGMEVIHTQALFSLTDLHVSRCVNLSRIVELSQLSNLKHLSIEGCLKLTEIMVGPGHFKHLDRVSIIGCYGLSDWQVPHINEEEEEEDTEVLLEWSLNATGQRRGTLNVKMNPAMIFVIEQKIKDLIGCQDMCCFFRKLPPKHVHDKHVLSLPFIPNAVAICLITSVYAGDLPRHIPLPEIHFHFFTGYEHYNDYDEFCGFKRFDCGEEIHFTVLPLPFGIRGDIKSCDDDIYVNITKGKFINGYKDLRSCHNDNPSGEAVVKDGWMLYLGSGKEYLAKEIRSIFYSEVRKQRLISWAWTQLPSQLHIHEFSALDIAGCQITKLSRHGNTCIMKEESGLIWSKRRCLFMDDHALLLHHPKGSEHSFLAYPEIDRDLERAIANLYEMSISILVNGEVVSSRKLQQITPITEEEIPPHLNTLLQGRDFHSSSETMRRVKLVVLQKMKEKCLGYYAVRL